LSGALVGISTIILPETLGRHLPRNIKEAEENKAFGFELIEYKYYNLFLN
jgi:hypothetical protein